MPAKKEGSDSPVMRKVHLEEKLIENLVQLQKVHTDLAEKFDKLSEQIASLLSLFEGAAQSFAKNPVNQFSEKDQEFLEKIDKLLDQNKTIAKGLTMMEERIRDKMHSPASSTQGTPDSMDQKDDDESPTTHPIMSSASRPLPRF